MTNKDSQNKADSIEVPQLLGYIDNEVTFKPKTSNLGADYSETKSLTMNSEDLNQSIEVPLDEPFTIQTLPAYKTMQQPNQNQYQQNNHSSKYVVQLQHKNVPISIEELQQKNHIIILEEVNKFQNSDTLSIKDIYLKCKIPVFQKCQVPMAILNIIIPGCGLACGCCCYGCKRPNCWNVMWTGVIQFITIVCFSGIISAWTIAAKMICQ